MAAKGCLNVDATTGAVVLQEAALASELEQEVEAVGLEVVAVEVVAVEVEAVAVAVEAVEEAPYEGKEFLCFLTWSYVHTYNISCYCKE
jgi:hypothetical protein